MKKLSVIIPVFNQEELIKRAIESVPKRDDVEIIVVNDGSTDKTEESVLQYDVRYFKNPKNCGVATAVNVGLRVAEGDYIVLLGSDDFFYPEVIQKLLDEYVPLNKDLIYFDLETNDGTIFHLCETTREGYCGSVKFMKRKFISGIYNNEDYMAAEDYYFMKEIVKRNPSEVYTGLVAKHYNYPRQGSLSDLRSRKMI